MYISSINSLSSFKQTQTKYKQPTLSDQLPSIALGMTIGGIGGAIYGNNKNSKGKKLGFCIAETASSCGILADIIYLIIHPPKKISTTQVKPKTNKNTTNINDGNNIAFKGLLDYFHSAGEPAKKKNWNLC